MLSSVSEYGCPVSDWLCVRKLWSNIHLKYDIVEPFFHSQFSPKYFNSQYFVPIRDLPCVCKLLTIWICSLFHSMQYPIIFDHLCLNAMYLYIDKRIKNPCVVYVLVNDVQVGCIDMILWLLLYLTYTNWLYVSLNCRIITAFNQPSGFGFMKSSL